MQTWKIAAVLLMGCASACGKSGGGSTSDAAIDSEPYTPPPGQDATTFLAPAVGVNPVPTDALSAALDLAAADHAVGTALTGDDGGVAAQATTATINILKAAAHAKETLAPATFPDPASNTYAPAQPDKQAALRLLDYDTKITPELGGNPYDGSWYDPKKDVVALDSAAWGGKTEITVSRMTQIPVKNQGQRGTCGTHAGVGFLEYMVLKKYSSKLSTVDLSEQRFYVIARPDLMEKGGGVTDQDGGSSWSQGFQVSLGFGGKTVPSNDQKYNIPLEADCPYNNAPGANEQQIPQLAACRRGSVRVTSVSETFGNSDGKYYSSSPRTAQEIFDYLKTYDLPFPTAVIIDDAWSHNDGMITYAADKTPVNVRGGHGILIVGARRLDEAKFPGEGGMCFLTKNSWGEGWGVNGYACMTLTWFNRYRENFPFGVAFDIDVDIDYVVSKAALSLPAGISNVGAALADTSGELEPMPHVVTLKPAPVNPNLKQKAASDPAPALPPSTPPAAPAAAKTVTTDGFAAGTLAGKGGALAKALYKIDGTTIAIAGVMQGEGSVTKVLTLPYDAASGAITFVDAARGKKTVGKMADGRITLCQNEFAPVCTFNLVPSDKTLLVALTEEEFRRHEADPDASYTTLVQLAGYGIDFALAGGNYADFRLKLGGVPTNPLRFKVDIISGAVTYKDREIGNYQKLELCSGSHRDVCRFIVNTEDKSLNVFLRKAQ